MIAHAITVSSGYNSRFPATYLLIAAANVTPISAGL
jgi:hypothetical protein